MVCVVLDRLVRASDADPSCAVTTALELVSAARSAICRCIATSWPAFAPSVRPMSATSPVELSLLAVVSCDWSRVTVFCRIDEMVEEEIELTGMSGHRLQERSEHRVYGRYELGRGLVGIFEIEHLRHLLVDIDAGGVGQGLRGLGGQG